MALYLFIWALLVFHTGTERDCFYVCECAGFLYVPTVLLRILLSCKDKGGYLVFLYAIRSYDICIILMPPNKGHYHFN